MSSFTFDGTTATVPFPATFPLECKPCQISIVETSFKRGILRHSKKCRQRPVNSAEAKDVVFESIYCGLWSKDRRKATTHQSVHFGDRSMIVKTYDCATCNNSFGTQKALSSHKRQCKQLARPGATRSVLPRVEEVVPQATTAQSNGLNVDEDHSLAVPETTTSVVVPVDDDDMAAANVSLRSVSSVSLDESVDPELLMDDMDMIDCNDWFAATEDKEK